MEKKEFKSGIIPLVISLTLALLPASLLGVRSESVIHETHQHFLNGELKNVSLHRDGRLTLAPGASEIGSLVDAVIWSVAAGPDGSFYIGAGNEGNVYHLSPGGELAQLFTTGEVFVRALALDGEGRLYAGTSPDGKVYRYTGDEEPEVFFDPRETYIWALLFGPEGDLFVGTGDEGRIYRIPAGAEAGSPGEVYFDSEETHISTLTWDQEERLLAGTSPNGYVYRLEEREKGFLLFNSPDEEVRQIVVGGEGELFVGTFSSTPAQGSGVSAGASTVAQAIASLAAGGNDENAKPESPPAAARRSGAGGASGTRPSTIYRVDAAGFHEPFWGLPNVSIHSFLKLEEGPLLIGTGNEGRIFSLEAFQSWKLRQTLPSGSDVSAMLPLSGGTDVIAFTSNPARIYRLDFGVSGEGEFLSEIFDAGQVASWGRLYAEATGSGGNGLETFVRTGNTEKADSTWSTWRMLDAMGNGAGETPAARYFQYRLLFGQPETEVRRVRFFYRHSNAAPVIQAMRIITSNLGLERFELPPQTPTIDLDQLFRNPPPPRSRSGPEPRQQIRAYERPGTVTVAWQARDPNEDELIYTVKLREAASDTWNTIGEGVLEPFFSFNGNGFPEGKYQAKVVVSDRLSNAPWEAREARRVSEAFVIDNTAPAINVEEVAVDGSSVIVRFLVSDQISIIAAADYILNGDSPVALFPEDGIFDAREEHFRVDLNQLAPGRHSLLLRVADEATNLRVYQVTFKVEAQ